MELNGNLCVECSVVFSVQFREAYSVQKCTGYGAVKCTVLYTIIKCTVTLYIIRHTKWKGDWLPIF